MVQQPSTRVRILLLMVVVLFVPLSSLSHHIAQATTITTTPTQQQQPTTTVISSSSSSLLSPHQYYGKNNNIRVGRQYSRMMMVQPLQEKQEQQQHRSLQTNMNYTDMNEMDHPSSLHEKDDDDNIAFTIMSTILVGGIALFFMICTYQIIRKYMFHHCYSRNIHNTTTTVSQQQNVSSSNTTDTAVILVHDGRVYNITNQQRQIVLEAILSDTCKAITEHDIHLLHVPQPMNKKCPTTKQDSVVPIIMMEPKTSSKNTIQQQPPTSHQQQHEIFNNRTAYNRTTNNDSYQQPSSLSTTTSDNIEVLISNEQQQQGTTGSIENIVSIITNHHDDTKNHVTATNTTNVAVCVPSNLDHDHNNCTTQEQQHQYDDIPMVNMIQHPSTNINDVPIITTPGNIPSTTTTIIHQTNNNNDNATTTSSSASSSFDENNNESLISELYTNDDDNNDINSVCTTNDDDNVCSICLSGYNQGDIFVESKHCTHGFHKDCILQWLQHHDECPICRVHMITTTELNEAVRRHIVGKTRMVRAVATMQQQHSFTPSIITTTTTSTNHASHHQHNNSITMGQRSTIPRRYRAYT